MLHPRDVAGAHDGGADRIFVVDDLEAGRPLGGAGDGLGGVQGDRPAGARDAPAQRHATRTTGGELTRLVGLGEDYLAVGAEGVSFGFLTSDLTVDVEVCAHLADALGVVPWTFHRAIDASLETSLAWRRLRGLPGLDAVLSAGSSQGMDSRPRGAHRPGRGRPRGRRPADGRRRAARRARAVAGPRRGAPVPGGTRRSVPAARGRRTWTPATSGPGGCCSTTPRTGRRDGRPGDAADRPAELPGHGRLWSHLASDTSYAELHRFAQSLGIPQRGFDRDHYDIPAERYDAVVAAGAEPVSSRELITRLKAAGLRRRKAEALAPKKPGRSLIRARAAVAR